MRAMCWIMRCRFHLYDVVKCVFHEVAILDAPIAGRKELRIFYVLSVEGSNRVLISGILYEPNAHFFPFVSPVSHIRIAVPLIYDFMEADGKLESTSSAILERAGIILEDC